MDNCVTKKKGNRVTKKKGKPESCELSRLFHGQNAEAIRGRNGKVKQLFSNSLACNSGCDISKWMFPTTMAKEYDNRMFTVTIAKEYDNGQQISCQRPVGEYAAL